MHPAGNHPCGGIRISLWLMVVSSLMLAGCATTSKDGYKSERTFKFQRDTFAFANELAWEYQFDKEGHWHGKRREPPPDYALHCFVVARSAKQFFIHARFAPELPQTTAAEYRRLIRAVVHSSAVRPRSIREKVVIPGFADLYAFSQAHEKLLKEECGGAWQSYLQRGNWRMVFPFSQWRQGRTAEQLKKEIESGSPVVVHLVRFPQLSINHAIVLFGVRETPSEIVFEAYDPNLPGQPSSLVFDRKARRFHFPANLYFPGGRVDVYEIYRSWRY